MSTTPDEHALGLRGLDLFTLANKSISGFIPSYKPTGARNMHQPFCSHLEERFLLYWEYHPLVTQYQRGEISSAFARAYAVPTYLPTPYGIDYIYEGKPHIYLPDLVGTLSDGTVVIGEAGMEEDKGLAQNLAKAEAARRFVGSKGGKYWIGTENTLPLHRHYNLIYLHARRPVFPLYDTIAEAILAAWPFGTPLSVAEVMQLYGMRWSEMEVEAAMWKIAADAAAAGRLLVDLSQVNFDRQTPLRLLDPALPPLLPDALPHTLEVRSEPKSLDGVEDDATHTVLMQRQSVLPGPPYDDTQLPEPVRHRFLRNLHAVLQVRERGRLRQTAHEYEMAASTLSRLVARTQTLGEKACVPFATYQRTRALDPAFCQILSGLERIPNLTVTAMSQHVELRTCARKLSEERKELVMAPSYNQVWDYIHYLRTYEREKPSDKPHHQHFERKSVRGFIHAIPAPALICQVDEHYLDLLIVLPDGTVVTRRVNAAVLICVKTGSILGAIIVPGVLTDEDYMQLLKQAMEPKDTLVTRMGCRNSWPCYGKPAVIFSDRGKIFVSKRARQVIVDRLGIISEVAPPYCPPAKGTVEALFRWMTQKFEIRMPNSTKTTTDPIKAAQEAGILFEDLERYFMRAVVDDYQQDWDKLRGQFHDDLWRAAVQQFGVPHYLGSSDTLKLLLMKGVNRKSTAGRFAVHDAQRLSFKGYWYVSPGVLSRLRGREFDIYYSRRDIGVIYLFVDAEYVGEAYCLALAGRRLSEWEAVAERKRMQERQLERHDRSLVARQDIQADALAQGKKQQKKSAKAIRHEAREQLYDRQQDDIHPDAVQEELRKRRETHRAKAGKLPVTPPDTDVPPVRMLRIRTLTQKEAADEGL